MGDIPGKVNHCLVFVPYKTFLGACVADAIAEMGGWSLPLIWKMNSCVQNGLAGRVVEPTESTLMCWRVIGANHLKCAPLLEL